MKIIRFKELNIQNRPDGRTVAKIIQEDYQINVPDMQILFVTHPANLKEELHSHNKSYEILVFLDNANYSINGNKYKIYKNDVVIFEPGDIHGAIPIDNDVKIWVFQNPAIISDKTIIK